MKINYLESMGFAMEIIAFVLAGFFVTRDLIATFFFGLIGLYFALVVGEKIKKDAILEYKEEKKEVK